MATLSEKLAQSLEALKELQDKGIMALALFLTLILYPLGWNYRIFWMIFRNLKFFCSLWKVF